MRSSDVPLEPYPETSKIETLGPRQQRIPAVGNLRKHILSEEGLKPFHLTDFFTRIATLRSHILRQAGLKRDQTTVAEVETDLISPKKRQLIIGNSRMGGHVFCFPTAMIYPRRVLRNSSV